MTYMTLLRGINVGGKRKVDMKLLKAARLGQAVSAARAASMIA
jgi:uncharacterized protein (DUF1697 family)